MAKPEGGVQSVGRAFHLLELIAESSSDLSLSELAALVALPTPTTHRLLKTLVALGYARQLSTRRYGLGMGLVRLGEQANMQFAPMARPHLEKLAERTGESANIAVLEGDMVVYIAQAPSPHPMRMFTEVGHRAHTHSTGVGKAILAELDPERVRKIMAKTGMPVATEHTITDLGRLEEELRRIKQQGYAIDEGEQAIGVRCYAVPVLGVPIPMALSISGPEFRVTAELGEQAVPLLKSEALELAAKLNG
ncbi:IclR family transcriptional regulator [Microlunatus panaciterrae]|uniref:IclR family transcriptional regulator n=1 Tax=Microlunatus panaciterrae TaxID=400768 RepID=UPI00308428FC